MGSFEALGIAEAGTVPQAWRHGVVGCVRAGDRPWTC